MSTSQKIILVTGGAGFIGTHLCKRLLQDGHKVISLDNYFTGSKDNHIKGVEYREGHTKDIAKLIPETPDIVYHLGEYSRVEQSLLEPDIVHNLNVVGTNGVFKFWKKCKCRMIYAGSSTKFGDNGLARDTTPYASTKARNSELVKKIGNENGLSYAITYFYNVYGPGERSNMYGTVIEIFKQMYRRGTLITVVAPGTQTRNFTHINDIIDGLILVGNKGDNDEYSLGNEESFAILDIAHMFGGEVVMLPSRAGNRMQSTLDVTKISALGWKPKHTLSEYIHEFVATCPRGGAHGKRILVFSTTFYPTIGPAENALIELIRKMPDVQFDIITTAFSRDAKHMAPLMQNANVHYVGFGNPIDKYMLPILGYKTARKLIKKHTYLFTWSLMASYAALAGVFLKRTVKTPLLITLADQNLKNISPFVQLVLTHILSNTDQVYGTSASQERCVAEFMPTKELRHSIGDGDVFANQLRYSYAEIILNQHNISPAV